MPVASFPAKDCVSRFICECNRLSIRVFKPKATVEPHTVSKKVILIYNEEYKSNKTNHSKQGRTSGGVYVEEVVLIRSLMTCTV